ncbi:hypothetical protein [Mycobacterium timonense]|uniref:hypothetical protein n=1 Tax=Mycobacterium timonense TaxID=701043 RepID=UPI001301AF5C|nr:hypothetical protein [Mycobacterium timonense]
MRLDVLKILLRRLYRLPRGFQIRVLLRLSLGTRVTDQAIKEVRLRRHVNRQVPVHRRIHRLLRRRNRHRQHRQPTSRIQMRLQPISELPHMYPVLCRQRLGRRPLHLLGRVGLTLGCSTPGFVHLGGDAPLLISRVRSIIGAVSGPVVADNLVGTIRLGLVDIGHLSFPLPPDRLPPRHIVA